MFTLPTHARNRRLMFVTDDTDSGAGSQDDAIDQVDSQDDSDDDSDDGGSQDDADALGDKGKQALDRMKARLKAERERRVKAESERDAAKGDDEATKAKREAETAALAKANDRILRSEIKAAAKGVLADPADAFKFLDLDSFEVDDDGNVDEDALAEALADLVKKKPYLAAQGGRRFQGGADGGTRKDSKPAQLTEADVKRLSAQNKFEEIEKARTEGRLNDLLGIKTS